MDAVKLYEKHSPDIVFTDLSMPEYDGLYAVENIKDKNPNAKIIVVTANSKDYDLHFFEVLNIPVITKPFDMNIIKSLKISPLQTIQCLHHLISNTNSKGL